MKRLRMQTEGWSLVISDEAVGMESKETEEDCNRLHVLATLTFKLKPAVDKGSVLHLSDGESDIPTPLKRKRSSAQYGSAMTYYTKRKKGKHNPREEKVDEAENTEWDRTTPILPKRMRNVECSSCHPSVDPWLPYMCRSSYAHLFSKSGSHSWSSLASK